MSKHTTESFVRLVESGDLNAICDAFDAVCAERTELLEAMRPFAEPHAMGDNYVQFAPRLIASARAAIAKATKEQA